LNCHKVEKGWEQLTFQGKGSYSEGETPQGTVA
jgi:hypothetical protein